MRDLAVVRAAGVVSVMRSGRTPRDAHTSHLRVRAPGDLDDPDGEAR